ncbi:MAG TPA: hypothetical protein VLI93_06125 [Acetobacteraceae bacterium]|nr:hypothetical protein [Acetobacteraceae bacterium]
MNARQFRLVLIKPSHYDDDGYVIQWFRSSTPSNSLAAMHGLATDCAQRQVLGPDTEITVVAYDETDTFHVVTAHQQMAREAWQETYRKAWETYYSLDHMCTLMRRAAACRVSLGKMLTMLLTFWTLSLLERAHPMEGGYLRRKVRTERRPGLPVVPAWRFWPAFAADCVWKHLRIAHVATRLLLLRRELKRDPAARDYKDLALTPTDTGNPLELFTVTEAARTAARAPMRKMAVAG